MRFGLELLSVALRESDRQWVPLMLTKYRRATFETQKEADTYGLALLRLQPHLELKTMPLDD